MYNIDLTFTNHRLYEGCVINGNRLTTPAPIVQKRIRENLDKLVGNVTASEINLYGKKIPNMVFGWVLCWLMEQRRFSRITVGNPGSTRIPLFTHRQSKLQKCITETMPTRDKRGQRWDRFNRHVPVGKAAMKPIK